MPIILRGLRNPLRQFRLYAFGTHRKCIRRAYAIVCQLIGTSLTQLTPRQLAFSENPIASMRAQDLPSYDDIPAVPGMPHGCAWGLWDKNGEKDELGTLNLLTPEVVQEAGKEIRTGDRCVMKYFPFS
jgi:hypothetical protein